MKKIIAVSLFLLVTVFTAMAQNPFGNFKVDHWDTKKGMPNDFVLNTYQTKEGFIWMTGYSGLTRFDGVSFTTFNSTNEALFKTDAIVSLIMETDDSTLWIPTGSSGLLSYKNGKFKAYLQELPTLFLSGISKNNELLLVSRNARSDFFVFNPTTKKYFKKPIGERASWLTGSPTLMESTGKSKGTGDDWRIVNNKPMYGRNETNIFLGEKEGVAKDLEFGSVYKDTKGRVWMGTNNGLYLWNGSKIEMYPGMDKVTTIPGNPTYGLIAEDHEKGIWVASNLGLLYLPDGASKFLVFPQMESMRLQTINNISCDREGNIWLASDRGLFKITKSKVVNYSEKDGILNNRVTGVCQLADDTYIVSSRDKLYQLKKSRISPFPLHNKDIPGQSNSIIHLYQDANKNIWVCDDKVIHQISSTGEKSYPADGSARFATTGIDGRVYFGIAYKGIGFINAKGKFEYLDFPKADLKSLYLSSIRQLRDGTWIITSFNKGVTIIDPKGNAKTIERFNNIEGVGVFSSYQDPDGVLWFASGNGIAKYEHDSIQSLGLKDGIPEVSIFEVLADQHGYFWFPSNKGVIRAKKSQILARMADKKSTVDWMLYDEGDGMINRQCVGARHSIVSTDGKIMVVGIGGLIEIDPAHLNKNLIKPSMIVHRMSVDDSVMDLSKPIIISPGDHRFSLRYSALSFKAPEKVAIKFRLVGYDKDWIISTGDRRAFYTNLTSGHYTFQIIAANNDGVWNEEPVSLSFDVMPFFYETTWFRILAFFVLIGIIWLLIQWRTRASRERSVLLEQQVSLRTEELKKSNAQVLIQKQEVEQALEKIKSTQSQLIQSEKMASLGELTAGIAHEIQNPLNFVNNFSEVNSELIKEMKQELDKGNFNEAKAIAKDIDENEQKINHHGKRADAIVKGMLQHSRSSNGVKEPTNINVLADEYLRLAYHGLRAKDKSFNATMITDYDDSIGMIMLIPQDMGRVILNLITNAFYAVVEKKKQIGEGYEPTVSVSTRKNMDKIEIRVQDNGNGVPQKVLDKIFQPFFTTKPPGQGTGLGLSLSYDIVKAHGGELTIETKEKEGSVFTIHLPV